MATTGFYPDTSGLPYYHAVTGLNEKSPRAFAVGLLNKYGNYRILPRHFGAPALLCSTRPKRKKAPTNRGS